DYQYRYCWIRDQGYAGQAVATLGRNPLLTAALHFITDRILEDKEELKPAYRVDGGPVPEQHDIGLPGYPGGSNIAGNWVRGQFQLDTFGEALNLYAVQPNTTSWTPRAGRPCDYAETSSKTTGNNPMPEYGNSTMPIGHIRVYPVLPGYVVSHGTWIVGKQPVLRRWQIPSWPRLVLQV